MAMTLLCITRSTDKENARQRLLISNEYSVHKVEGQEEWHHPDPTSLRYAEFGNTRCDDRLASMMNTILYFGSSSFGSSFRFIKDEAAEIAAGREQSWDEKAAQDAAFYAQLERERQEQILFEEQQRAPIFEFCARCGGEQESCKNPGHRGRKCMKCCGGIGDRAIRHCSNCLDLPFRQKREKALGQSVVYAGEES